MVFLATKLKAPQSSPAAGLADNLRKLNIGPTEAPSFSCFHLERNQVARIHDHLCRRRCQDRLPADHDIQTVVGRTLDIGVAVSVEFEPIGVHFEIAIGAVSVTGEIDIRRCRYGCRALQSRTDLNARTLRQIGPILIGFERDESACRICISGAGISRER